jgi:hypothetical protein
LYEVTSSKTKDGYSRTKAKWLLCPSHNRKSLFLEEGQAQSLCALSQQDLKPGTLASIVAQAGLTVEEFVDLL